MQRFLFAFTAMLFFVMAFLSEAFADPMFFYTGDGTITMSTGRGGSPQKIRFRDDNGAYIESALKRINGIFHADWESPEWRISLRLIELLDFIQDHFSGGNIHIIDGFRGPVRNRTMRDQGKLAASSSLHLDGEAADIIMAGVPSVNIRDFLIPLDCCGVGYYHGKAVHVDIGPPRFWDETTSGTEKKEPPENEAIVVRPEKDIYRDGDNVTLQFARVNIYPFGVKRAARLKLGDDNGWKFLDISPNFPAGAKGTESGDCVVISNRREARSIVWKADINLKKPKKARIQVEFCNPKTDKMPSGVESSEFVLKPKGEN